MLYVDVRALSEIVSILMRAMSFAGKGSEFPLALDQLSHAIDSALWEEKIRYFRSLWYLLEEDDQARAIRELSAIELDACRDPEILQLHLQLASSGLSLAERLRLVDRVLAVTEKESEKLQYSLVKAMYYALVGEETDAMNLVRTAVDRYRAQDSLKRSEYGEMFLAEALSFLGRLDEDQAATREALGLYEQLISDRLEKGASRGGFLASLRKSAGDCCLTLREFGDAVFYYQESLSTESAELTKLFLAKAWIELEDLDRGRSMLAQIDVTAFDENCMLDRALFTCDLALKSRTEADRLEAISLLKAATATHPLFEKYRQDALLGLIELKPCGSPKRLQQVLQRLGRYVTLNPNLFGFGLDLNKVLDDIASSRRNRGPGSET